MSEVVRALELPPARDFLLSAGFAGIAALFAAVFIALAIVYGSRRAWVRFATERDQDERHHEQRREDEQRAAAIQRCWDRWWQVVETAAIEPAASEGATLGLGPEVALVLLNGLLREAEDLGDATLSKAVAVYQEQLLLVLAQQGGQLAKRSAPQSKSSINGTSRHSPASKEPARESAGQSAESVSVDVVKGSGADSAEPEGVPTGRRRRR